jgi:two-component system, chemotaxis family, protein-glutamate methylesterase/glutaminase
MAGVTAAGRAREGGSMPTVIAIGTSSGGPRILVELLGRLPQDFPAAFMVAAHLDPHRASHLPDILSRATPLRVVSAEHGTTVTEGTVYVSVPDRHLILAGAQIRLTRGPRENHSRPAIDVLFRSCALSLGPKAIGVVLTGALDDGTAGLWAIKDRRGQAIVQLPQEAEFPSMPQNALLHVATDYVARIADMPGIFLKAIEESRRRAGGVRRGVGANQPALTRERARCTKRKSG